MAEVKLKNIYKKYPGGVTAVNDFNLDIADKEFIVLVGPSGCGKSTTLRMIAGLEEITSGELLIDGKLVNDIAPKDRDIAMVFQNYALYPHMTVFENMAFGLKLRKTLRERSRRECRKLQEYWKLSICLTDPSRLCPVVSVRELPWAVPLSVSLRSSLWTNLCPTWMPSSVHRCVLRSSSSTRDCRQPLFM